jgi:cytochrome P450
MTSLAELVRLEDTSFYWDNPYPVLRRLRREEPAFYYEPMDMWVVSRYEDIRYVGRTPEIFSNHAGLFFSDFRYAETGGITKSLFFHADAENIGLMGPPRHNEVRKIAGAAFTPRILADMRERIRKVVRDLLEPIRAGEPVNWSRQISEPLPLLVIAILMGLPVEEYEKLKFFSDEIIKVGLDASPEEIGEIVARLEPMDGYFENFLSLRDKEPTSDLLGVLRQANRDGQISEATVQTLLRAVLTAGNETTRNTLNGGIIGFCETPGQMKLLAEQPDLAKSATEECLRYVSPVRGFGRTLIQDTELHGRKLWTGQRVLNFFMSGNRDEEVFKDPDAFDIAKPRDRANVAFGFGQHFCIGAAVARLEITILFEELAARFSEVQLVGSPHRDYQQLNFYGWEDVHVVFN